MSLLPLELRNTYDGAKATAQIERALRIASRRIATRQTLRVALATLPLPVLAAALWVGLSRFTLLSLSDWPLLLFAGVWLAGMVVVALTRRVPASHAARYLDRTLS